MTFLMENTVWLFAALIVGILSGLIVGVLVARRNWKKAAANTEGIDLLDGSGYSPSTGGLPDTAETFSGTQQADIERYYQQKIAALEKEYQQKLQELETDLTELNRSLLGVSVEDLLMHVDEEEEQGNELVIQLRPQKSKSDADMLAIMAAAAESRLLSAADDDDLVLLPSDELAKLSQKVKRLREGGKIGTQTNQQTAAADLAGLKEPEDLTESEPIKGETRAAGSPNTISLDENRSWMAVIDADLEDELHEEPDAFVYQARLDPSRRSENESKSKNDEKAPTLERPKDTASKDKAKERPANQLVGQPAALMLPDGRVGASLTAPDPSIQEPESGVIGARNEHSDVAGEERQTDTNNTDCWQEGEGTWKVEFFDNRDLKGDPILTRQDAALDFDLVVGSPESFAYTDGFSASWYRVAKFRGGSYQFTIKSIDSVRFWIGGRLIISAWYDHAELTLSNTLQLPEGLIDMQLEYSSSGPPTYVKLSCHRMR